MFVGNDVGCSDILVDGTFSGAKGDITIVGVVFVVGVFLALGADDVAGVECDPMFDVCPDVGLCDGLPVIF